MKLSDYQKALRLSADLTAELQRLEHKCNDEPRHDAGEASDELSHIRLARDYVVDSRDILLLLTE